MPQEPLIKEMNVRNANLLLRCALTIIKMILLDQIYQALIHMKSNMLSRNTLAQPRCELPSAVCTGYSIHILDNIVINELEIGKLFRHC